VAEVVLGADAAAELDIILGCCVEVLARTGLGMEVGIDLVLLFGELEELIFEAYIDLHVLVLEMDGVILLEVQS
jgi:hypothetical protein